MFEEVVDAVQQIKGRGRAKPTKPPQKIHAGKAYGDKRCRKALSVRAIRVRIARKRMWKAANGLEDIAG